MFSDTFRVVRHRDGTSTSYCKVELGLHDVARRFLIWIRWLPIGWSGRLQEGSYWIEREFRSGFNPDGSRRSVTRLCVSDPSTGDVKEITKTDLGRMYFGACLESLDESGVSFWEDQSKPNCWILADTFAV